jgi:hypothetical protein
MARAGTLIEEFRRNEIEVEQEGSAAARWRRLHSTEESVLYFASSITSIALTSA